MPHLPPSHISVNPNCLHNSVVSGTTSHTGLETSDVSASWISDSELHHLFGSIYLLSVLKKLRKSSMVVYVFVADLDRGLHRGIGLGTGGTSSKILRAGTFAFVALPYTGT